MKEKETKWEKPRGKKVGAPPLSLSFRRFLQSYLPSMLGEEDDVAAGLGAEESAVNPRPIKRTKQTYFFLRRSYRAAMSVSRITRCQMPIIFTRRWQLRCAALGRAPKKKGRAISAAKGRRSVLQFRRNDHVSSRDDHNKIRRQSVEYIRYIYS